MKEGHDEAQVPLHSANTQNTRGHKAPQTGQDLILTHRACSTKKCNKPHLRTYSGRAGGSANSREEAQKNTENTESAVASIPHITVAQDIP